MINWDKENRVFRETQSCLPFPYMCVLRMVVHQHHFQSPSNTSKLWMLPGMNKVFGSCKRLGGNWSQRIKLIFWEMIQAEEHRSEEGTPCWAACRTQRAPEITVAKPGRKLEEAEGEGPEEPVLEQTVGDLSLGMLLGSACVHLASDPPLPIKIKKLIFFCLPPRTQLFLWNSKWNPSLSMAGFLIVFVVLSLIPFYEFCSQICWCKALTHQGHIIVWFLSVEKGWSF